VGRDIVKVFHGDFLHILNKATHTVGPWAGIQLRCFTETCCTY